MPKYLFIAILLLAAFFRLYGLNWDQNQHLHPDERFLTMVSTSLKWPPSIYGYFDTLKSPRGWQAAVATKAMTPPMVKESDNWIIGLLAAFFYTSSVLPIQLSHFF